MHISYSQYTKWANCPWQWKLEYVDGFKDPDSIHTVFGTAMHTTIQQWLTDRHSSDKKIKAKYIDLHEVLKEELLKLAKEKLVPQKRTTKEELFEFYSQGCQILDHCVKYLKEIINPKWKLIGVEVPLLIDVTSGIQFKGFIDLVFYSKSDNKYYIFDLKTSTSGWSEFAKKDVKKTDQLLLYKTFYSRQYDVPIDKITVEFIILKRKITSSRLFLVKHIGKFSPTQGSKKTIEAYNRFMQFASIFDDTGAIIGALTPTPSKSACKFCKFNSDSLRCGYGITE